MRITERKMAADLACDYHTASCNSPWLLRLPVIRQINYSEQVQDLMDEGPRKIDSKSEISEFQKITDAPSMTLVQALSRRKSSRDFSAKALPLQRFGELLGLSNGLRAKVGNAVDAGRNAPSAGSLCSCEIYVLALNVEGVEKGLPSYREEDGQRVMKAAEITIRVNLNRGDEQASVWTCDLSLDYVRINADYRS